MFFNRTTHFDPMAIQFRPLTSQVLQFNTEATQVTLRDLHVLLVFIWVFSGFTSFLLLTRNYSWLF